MPRPGLGTRIRKVGPHLFLIGGIPIYMTAYMPPMATLVRVDGHIVLESVSQRWEVVSMATKEHSAAWVLEIKQENKPFARFTYEYFEMDRANVLELEALGLEMSKQLLALGYKASGITPPVT